MKNLVLLLGCLLVFNVLAANAPKAAKLVGFEIRAVVDGTSTNAEELVLIRQTVSGQIAQERLFIEKKVLLNNSFIKNAKVQSNITTGEAEIGVTLTKAGAKRLAQVTREHVGTRLAILLDGKICSAPVVQAEITGGVISIPGSFSQAEATAIAERLNRH